MRKGLVVVVVCVDELYKKVYGVGHAPERALPPHWGRLSAQPSGRQLG